jgi:hypothetical protein
MVMIRHQALGDQHQGRLGENPLKLWQCANGAATANNQRGFAKTKLTGS